MQNIECIIPGIPGHAVCGAAADFHGFEVGDRGQVGPDPSVHDGIPAGKFQPVIENDHTFFVEELCKRGGIVLVPGIVPLPDETVGRRRHGRTRTRRLVTGGHRQEEADQQGCQQLIGLHVVWVLG